MRRMTGHNLPIAKAWTLALQQSLQHSILDAHRPIR
jgi:hypothetical protein